MDGEGGEGGAWDGLREHGTTGGVEWGQVVWTDGDSCSAVSVATAHLGEGLTVDDDLLKLRWKNALKLWSRVAVRGNGEAMVG